MRELCCRCRFAGSVHANNQNHGGFASRATNWRRVPRQNAGDFFTHGFDDVANSEQSPRFAFLKCFDNSQCHRHTEIGADESFFQLIPVDRFSGELFGEGLKKIHVSTVAASLCEACH